MSAVTRVDTPASSSLQLSLVSVTYRPHHSPIKRMPPGIKALTKTERGAPVAVLAERGGGMSAFLRLMKNDLGESMRIVDCPPGGFERFRDALADEIGLNRTVDLTTQLGPRLESLGS